MGLNYRIITDDFYRANAFTATSGGNVYVPFSRSLGTTNYIVMITLCSNGSYSVGYDGIVKEVGGFWLINLAGIAEIEYFAALYN